MTERDSKRIVRQWNREIEDEIRRAAAHDGDAAGPWKAVTWTVLWVLWLALLILLLAHVKSLG